MKDTLVYVDEIVYLSECNNVGMVTPMNDVFVWNVHTSKFWNCCVTDRISTNSYHFHGICSYDPCNMRRLRLFWVYFLIFYCRRMLNQTLKRGMYWS